MKPVPNFPGTRRAEMSEASVLAHVEQLAGDDEETLVAISSDCDLDHDLRVAAFRVLRQRSSTELRDDRRR